MTTSTRRPRRSRTERGPVRARSIIAAVAAPTDVLCWTIERDGAVASVREDGRVTGDDQGLCDYLGARLREPVVVYRRGTVRPGPAAVREAARPVRLAPGDRRYVVARIRTLTAEDPGLRLRGIEWV